MSIKGDLEKSTDDFFSGTYEVTDGYVIPDVDDIQLGKKGRELDLSMVFIDIRESTKIVDGFRRETAAKMYKSFLYSVAKIARSNGGELRSFNGDGVLIAFNGDLKRTNAVKASMQMAWYCKNILKPRLDKYFANNNQLKDVNFDFGIGVDVGKVLVVRGGIRGENNNDLVWVGNATNYAVKLSSLSKDDYHIYISEDVYKNMYKSSKFGGPEGKNMWEERSWTAMDGQTIYRTSWAWSIN
jgi:class 3 adenylate cyclase